MVNYYVFLFLRNSSPPSGEGKSSVLRKNTLPCFRYIFSADHIKPEYVELEHSGIYQARSQNSKFLL